MKQSEVYLFLVSLLELHKVALVLHVHSRHQLPLVTQHLLQVHVVRPLLLQLALQLRVCRLGRHNLRRVQHFIHKTINLCLCAIYTAPS